MPPTTRKPPKVPRTPGSATQGGINPGTPAGGWQPDFGPGGGPVSPDTGVTTPGNPNATPPVYSPLSFKPSMNNGFGSQQVDGATAPQYNTTGVPYRYLNSSPPNFNRGGYMQPPTAPPLNPTPVGPTPTWTPPATLPQYSVPGGRTPDVTQTGMNRYTSPTGLVGYTSGPGYRPASPGSGVAFERDPRGMGGLQQMMGNMDGFGGGQGPWGQRQTQMQRPQQYGFSPWNRR